MLQLSQLHSSLMFNLAQLEYIAEVNDKACVRNRPVTHTPLSVSLRAPCSVKVNNMSVMYKCWHALLLLLFVSVKRFMFAEPAWVHYADCRLYPGE